jgi:hypothetical protein
MRTLNLPNQIIFGSKLPQIEVMIEGSRQFMFSKNNYNLYREESDLDAKGTFTIGSLFKAAKNYPYCLRWTNITLPECETACEPCSMLAEKYEELRTGDALILDDSLALRRVVLREDLYLYGCELISMLLACTTTPAQRKFAEGYYNLAISWMDFPEDALFCFRNLSKTFGDFLQSWYENNRLAPEAKEPKQVIRAILDSLEAPALIPQVWFNYTYTRGQLQESGVKVPHCADFVFILENELHIVEIDSPSHYARLDSSGKWVVDEETYTTNLKIERYLHNQGYKVHRLSDYEILNASESELIELVIDALGMSPSHFRPKLLAPH